ncbi:DUF4055 domain-containing protein [uncultured Deefgea sp.]|uniref:DUF4055 domain-containing protein n=1 Tax=uncultured Deefgea sp. TaxID=1304914 RepID=UPI00262AA8DE|nr:DUF4055 domain-containing protein [uncultured Deefgea sp.]
MSAYQHPLYTKLLPFWKKHRDCFAGEETVKAAATEYLPATQSMIEDGIANASDDGAKFYASYNKRAVFPEYVSDAVSSYLGMMHRNPPTVQLPAELEYLRESATVSGDSVNDLLMLLNEQQLIMGRVVILLDVKVVDGKPVFYIAVYFGESAINWDSSDQGNLELTILDESGPVREGFNWVDKKQYRVLQLQNGVYTQYVTEDLTDAQLGTPVLVQGKPLESMVPLVYINTKDNNPTPEIGPMEPLCNECLAIYRGEADYRQSLFMQGQDTLVTVGGVRNALNTEGDSSELRTGIGSRIDLDIGGDAKYIGVNSSGLSEQREALKNDRTRAEKRAGRLISDDVGVNTSGESLRVRITAQSATLKGIAMTASSAVQYLFREAAKWIGVDPLAVIITPNQEFIDVSVDIAALAPFMNSVKEGGLPLSLETIHKYLKARGMTDLTFDDELAKIQQEPKLGLVPVVKPASGNGTATQGE